MFSKIKIKLSSILKDHGYNVEPKIFSVPPKIEMGDLALPCFELAKSQKKNPVELAKEICAKVSDKRILRAEPIGPYVNFYFKPEYYNKEVLNHQVKFAPNSGKVMIEYSQPNTHKEFHIGHLRNAVLGSALVNLKRFCGQNILAVNYIGDTGVHVAKWLWWFFKKYQGVLPIEKTDVFGKIYTEATTELEKNPEFSVEVSLMHRILEKSIEKSFNNAELSDEEKNILETWQKTKSASLEYFKKIYQKLNIDFDLWFYESEEEVAGKKLISEILNSKKIPQIKKSEGAVIADLREFNLDVLVLIKSDGNALYGAKDLP
ncbi:MAG: arginine--tRNA ligase, partial [Patescibacteria group bacterium]